MTTQKITRALLSVFDKTGIVELGQALHARGVEILSTGGTAKKLAEAGIPIVEVGAYTGFPEMMDGRVKTLHPKIHGGLLGRRDLDSHRQQMEAHDIGPIDLVAVNLYPFEQVAAKPSAAWAELIENIDIGGPSMLRSAAKNHAAVTVVCDPADYEEVIAALNADGGTRLEQRQRMALKVFQRTAAYDAAIASVLGEHHAREDAEQPLTGLGPFHALMGSSPGLLRYGENPHQKAAVYATGEDCLNLAGAEPLQGKALSYNNLLDAEGALFSLRCLTDGRDASADDRPFSVAIMKHATPCGAARGDRLVDTWKAALSGDPVSAFGGIVAVNKPIDAACAEAMKEVFLEVIIAPGFDDGAREVFARKKNLRLLAIEDVVSAKLPRFGVRSVPGGLLVQEHDRAFTAIAEAKVATERAPTADELQALDLAFRLCTAVKSNAITLASSEKLLGAGGGQTSRVDAVKLAVAKAKEHGHETEGAALGSDAFFPFADGVLAAIEAGVTCVAQPGGSKRDDEVIAACDAHDVAMVFTGERHFRH
jgi:phosphoribosylaminoimidazolecarboxamide formyltransferase/IMP cyclohydrolase